MATVLDSAEQTPPSLENSVDQCYSRLCCDILVLSSSSYNWKNELKLLLKIAFQRSPQFRLQMYSFSSYSA